MLAKLGAASDSNGMVLVHGSREKCVERGADSPGMTVCVNGLCSAIVMLSVV